MKAKKIASSLALFLIISILTFNNSCSERNETVSCFPDSIISATINLNSAHYYKLQNVGGWVYTLGEVGTGTKGLIIYRSGNASFMIYDRNAPQVCPANDTTLEVNDSGTKIIYSHNDAEWFLSTGGPLNDNAKIGLKTYRYYDFNPNTNTLMIYN